MDELDEALLVRRLSESNIARGSFALVVLAFVAVVIGACLDRRGTTVQQRFHHYSWFFARRHADWCGAQKNDRQPCDRMLSHIGREHSLLCLVVRPEWAPLAPLSFMRRLLVLLALVQADGAVAFLCLLPPIRDLQPELLQPWLAPLLSAVACASVHLLARTAFRWLHWRRSLVLFRRPDARGHTEGHVLARAALAHFDSAHTLRTVLRTWRRIAWGLELLETTFARLAYSKVLRAWRETCVSIDQVEAARRLRIQRLAAWSLADQTWVHDYCVDVGVHMRPLEAQLRLVMPLDDRLVDSLAVATHSALEPTISERMLERPPVSRARLLLGARWALAEWVGALRAMKSDQEARRVARTSLAARRTAAAARRAAALFAYHWGLHTWCETLELMRAREESRHRIASQMGSFGLQNEHLEHNDRCVNYGFHSSCSLPCTAHGQDHPSESKPAHARPCSVSQLLVTLFR